MSQQSLFDRDDIDFYVVVNGEEQYSIWPAHLEIPEGWKRVGEPASKAACLEQIEALWTDMRPLQLRNVMSVDQ